MAHSSSSWASPDLHHQVVKSSFRITAWEFEQCIFVGIITICMKGIYFESVEDLEVGMTAQLKTWKGTSRAASESDENSGKSVFKERGNILKGAPGSISFTIIGFKSVNIHYIFWLVLVYVNSMSYTPLNIVIYISIYTCTNYMFTWFDIYLLSVYGNYAK